MGDGKTNSNLRIHILEKVDVLLSQRLVNYMYYDVCSQEHLSTNNNGIDIISHQLRLDFTCNTIYISWQSVEKWMTYSLVVSENSFCEGAEVFTKADGNWDKIIGQQIIDYSIYGYQDNSEPHLLILEFENSQLLGIANFYFEENFIPTIPEGDDVWIIFGIKNLKICIESLQLEKLEK